MNCRKQVHSRFNAQSKKRVCDSPRPFTLWPTLPPAFTPSEPVFRLSFGGGITVRKSFMTALRSVFVQKLFPLCLLAILMGWPSRVALAEKLRGQGKVSVKESSSSCFLLRDGQPYRVKGICGSDQLELAAQLGANSLRTYSSENATAILNRARDVGMTVTLGVWLSHKAADYEHAPYTSKIRKEVGHLVALAKQHPAALAYSLGNETNSGADTPAAWGFIQELAETIHHLDPAHPVMTVLAGSKQDTLNRITKHVPALDLIGINAYGGIVNVARDLAASDFKKPYLVTEFGPLGPWEVAKTNWGAPLEPNSDQKAAFYQKAVSLIGSDVLRCLGAYVFLWGQKEERTPTWFGMFVENRPILGLKGESCPSVAVMSQAWTGKPPANAPPSIQTVLVDGTSPVNYSPAAGQKFTVEVAATDPDGDRLHFIWEVLEEAKQLGEGGSHEERPKSLPNAVKPLRAGSAEVTTPGPGAYRVYGYILDGKGHAACLNIPFLAR